MFEVGQKAKVIDNGCAYTTYREFIERNGKEYLLKFFYGHSPSNGVIGHVVVVAKHKNGIDDLAIIETNDCVFVMGVNGIEETDEDEDDEDFESIEEIDDTEELEEDEEDKPCQED